VNGIGADKSSYPAHIQARLALAASRLKREIIMQKADIVQAFTKAGLQARIPAIDRLVRPSIRLQATQVAEQTLAPGASKLGGHPDLPEQITWPGKGNTPLSFLAQIRLSDVQAYDSEHLLPPQGMLWFFYDAHQETFGEQPGDRAGWSILFEASATNLQRRSAPAALPAESRFPACALTPHSELTLALQPELELPAFDWSDREQQAYEAVLEALHPGAERAQPQHRLLGYPDTIQDDMREQCQLVSNGVTDSDDPRAAQLQKGNADWQLLLQIDSDAAAKMRWANNGMIYYWTRLADLRASRFDQSWLVLQSE
jgi:uncharacterized protein YwqG